jgi:hypothetical protein
VVNEDYPRQENGQMKSIRTKVVAANALLVVGALVAAFGAPLKWY